MTRKLFKVLKRKVAETLGWLLVTVLAAAIMAVYLGIPYLLGKYLIINIPIPILEEVSREECAIWCMVVTIFISGAIMLVAKFIRFVKNFIEEVKKEQ